MSQAWNPLNDLLLLQDRMNRLFQEATQRRGQDNSSADDLERAEWSPAADVYDNESLYVIAIDLPGTDKTALDIHVDEDRLFVKGNREIPEAKQHRTERPHGRFLRMFTIPSTVDKSAISAEYNDGVLKVVLPRRKEQKSQRVEIKVS
ncbi:MAG: Hsp20/alpha crystallin family protein [Pyrinomonadaceae bacterium]